ncbi:MAG: hypothetical protein AB1458_13500 [Bacteroidota bacterium]
MKLLVIWIVIGLFPFLLTAQSDSTKKAFSLYYRLSHVGHQACLEYAFKKNKRTFFAGLKYHINTPITDNRNYVFRHRFYAVNLGQAFGLCLGVEKSLDLPNSVLKPFVFGMMQFTLAKVRALYQYCDTTTIYVNGNPQTVYDIFERYVLLSTNLAAENYVGFGFQAQAYRKIILSLSVGAGAVIIFEKSDFDGRFYYRTWELGDIYRVGIKYCIR